MAIRKKDKKLPPQILGYFEIEYKIQL
jgi:hypothetical protein